jgi:hypothetical protein
MDFAGVIGQKMTAFANGLAGLAPYEGILSLTAIALALVLAPVAREWSQETRRQVGIVIFGVVIVGLIPAFVTALG